ncbi:hypothetical protein [Saccharomonospora piscinae]|uniref:Biotin synthase auxiliary protein n=1 Tax=Saccharomonospora piscinae TaxID=687388 RepID=A0A1V8ZX33_SACPI|nr:hypothetical protein [Saccharomonospora piscinae]OQO89333.1 hypothetical protein B1813_20515 [Saccharomonospora piscinae]TLW91025.1 hypothetical protein FFT09_17265 [Saccharomonospora piscinae]
MNTAYCSHCGQPRSAECHAQCDTPRTVLEPPRYCVECARRMVVQVTPSGWTARCSRHGETSSAGSSSTG